MKFKTMWKGFSLILATVLALTALACAPKAKKAPQTAAPAAGASGGVVIQGMDVAPSDAGAQITLTTSGPVSTVGYFLADPPRVIVDLPETALGAGVEKSYPVNNAVVRDVGVSTVPSGNGSISRITISLSAETDFEVKKEDGKIFIVVGRVAAPPSVASLPPDVAPQPPSETPSEIPGVEVGAATPVFMPSEASEAAETPSEPVAENLSPATRIDRITSEMDGNLVKIIISGNGSFGGFDAFTLPTPPRLVLDIPGVSISSPAMRVEVGKGDVGSVRLGRHPGKVRVVIDLKTALAHYSTVKQGDKLIINVGEGAEAAAPAPAAPMVIPVPSSEAGVPAIEAAPAEPTPTPSPEFPTEETPTENPSAPAETPAAIVGTETPAPAAIAPMEAAPPVGGYESVEITAVDFDWTQEKSTVRIETTGRAQYELVTNDRDKLISVRITNANIQTSLERSLDTSEFSSPVRMVSSYGWTTDNVKEVYVTMSLNYSTKYYVVREGNTIMVILENPAGGSIVSAPSARAEYAAGPQPGEDEMVITDEGAGPGGAQYFGGVNGSVRKSFTGRLVYLDYQKISVTDALSLLAEVAGLNLVISGEIKNTVSLKLEAVPWDQALDIILRTQGYGAVVQGNILRVAKSSELEDEYRKVLDRQKTKKIEEPLELRIVFVSYADPNDISKAVNSMLTKNRGRIEVDTRTNSLLIWDVPANLDKVEALIRRLDVETPQVLIEVRIVEAETTLTKELGVQWGVSAHSGAATGNPTGLNFPGTIDMGMGLPSGVSGAADSARGFGSSALGFTIGSLTNAIDLDLFLYASEVEQKAKVISSPRILTLDNQVAKISQGVAIPFSTTSAAGTETQFVDANLNVTVQPHVTSDGRIIMKIVAQRNTPVTITGASGPGINKNEAMTNILVKDGETAVIGGIYVISRDESQSRTPWLGKLPFVGWLFRTSSSTDDRRELIIFMTPRIVSGGEQYLKFANSPTPTAR